MELPPEKWERVKVLLEAALELKPEDTRAFLDDVCPERDVRCEVERLLTYRGQVDSFLTTPMLQQLTPPVVPQRLQPGTVLNNRFLIIRFIARGGMGEVYEAEDQELREKVAVKTIRQDLMSQPRFLQTFRREVRLAKQVTHPNVCRIYDLFRHTDADGDGTFVSMELLNGETLAERVKRSGQMTVEEALPIILQMADALGAAHDAGILHRDLKPGNVILMPSSKTFCVRAVVTDFGLAFDLGDSGTRLTSNTALSGMGTPAYMAPEQIEGREPSAATDIYALGLVMYEMVTGRTLFDEYPPLLAAAKRVYEPPESPRKLVADLDRGLETIILRCLEREPSKRPGTAREIIEALHKTGLTGLLPRKRKVKRWVSSPRIAAALILLGVSIVGSLYYFHSRRSQNLTSESATALKQAQAQYVSTRNHAAADFAIRQSAAYEQDKQYIEAYEVLADLPEAQRALVTSQMQALEANYVKSASDRAKQLKDAHVPIQGKADEIGVQKAYDYLRRASSLQPDDQNLKLRLELMSLALSDYYVAQGKKYLAKPLGSGVGVAWLYLTEAQQYQSNPREDVSEERTKNSAIHNIRSTLSIKVVFRDQTSRRDSAGFADQLSDSIAAGLETTALPVRIIRAADPTPVDPNFHLIGDVLEHRLVPKVTVDSIDSEFRAVEREVQNDEWNKSNRDYEAASMELQKQQKVLEGAQAHGKKKEIADANTAVEDAQKKVEEAHRKLDAIPKTILSDVVKPYSYTRKTIDLSAVVDVRFRIIDNNGNTIATSPSVKKEAQKQFIVLENVKPEDTKGVKQAGSPPDKAQFLTDVEIADQIALIKEVKEKIGTLPSKILAVARKRVMDGDVDGAAEAYILYLNSTPDTPTSERLEAKKFLREQFNMIWPGSSV